MKDINGNELEAGDYCIFSKYSDKDPNDPWWVGFLEKVEYNRFYAKNNTRGWRHAEKINKDTGDFILRTYPDLERIKTDKVD